MSRPDQPYDDEVNGILWNCSAIPSFAGGRVKRKRRKPLPEGVTDSMHRALHWLHAQGGEGAWVQETIRHNLFKPDPRWRVLVRGEFGPFADSTWRALHNHKLAEIGGHGRIKITPQGETYIKEYLHEQ